VEELHDKLEDIYWQGDVAWEETLSITSTNPTVVENVDDDLSRELAFYNQVGRSDGQTVRQVDERICAQKDKQGDSARRQTDAWVNNGIGIAVIWSHAHANMSGGLGGKSSRRRCLMRRPSCSTLLSPCCRSLPRLDR
jgi:Eukaryotic rRNA processing protein EBP2